MKAKRQEKGILGFLISLFIGSLIIEETLVGYYLSLNMPFQAFMINPYYYFKHYRKLDWGK